MICWLCKGPIAGDPWWVPMNDGSSMPFDEKCCRELYPATFEEIDA